MGLFHNQLPEGLPALSHCPNKWLAKLRGTNTGFVFVFVFWHGNLYICSIGILGNEHSISHLLELLEISFLAGIDPDILTSERNVHDLFKNCPFHQDWIGMAY